MDEIADGAMTYAPLKQHLGYKGSFQVRASINLKQSFRFRMILLLAKFL